ncbi:MAG: class I SAM-dependent RNA methyltransferase [Chitinophagaceae bacterium]
MNPFTEKSRVIVTCNNRLSPWLQKETELLGYHLVRNFATGIELFENVFDCIRLNMKLRCASQILYSLKTFRADGPSDIYDELMDIPWEELISADEYFSVTSQVDHPSITTPLYANVKVKDAIVDRIRNKEGRRPDSGPSAERIVVHLFWKEQQAEIFLDTSGETLAKHGYRKIPGKAPMLEALASATILASAWNGRSPFVNPMSGSGTLAIQAALLATNRFPGLFRDNYGFMHIKGYEDDWYKKELALLKSGITARPDGVKIIATDISEDAIEVSKINAGLAGVESEIEFSVCDFAETEVPAGETGIVYFNPEYGERLGINKDLEALYGRIGDFLKKSCQGYFGYVFTGNLELAKKIGLKPRRRYEFYSAKIDCRLLEYELYAGSRDKV